jgi:hypothetical protein
VTLLAVMLKSCLALITDELLNNSSDKLIFMSLNKVTNETDSVATHKMYRKWGKKWVASWDKCKIRIIGWGCKTYYEDRTKLIDSLALIVKF